MRVPFCGFFIGLTSAFLTINSLIMRVEGCFPLPQPGYYAPPQSYGYYGGGASPYASKARMASDTRLKFDNNIDDTVGSESNADDDDGTWHQQNNGGPQNYVGVRASQKYGKSGDASNDGSGCSHRFANKRLECATAFEKRTPSSEAECQRLCVDSLFSRCQSFQFDSASMTCDLFDVIPPLPMSTPLPIASGDEDADLVPFRDDQPVMRYDSVEGDETGYKHRFRRFALQNGISSAMPTATAPSSNPSANPLSNPFANGLGSLLKIPGITTENCSPSIESEVSSVYVTVDVQCFKKAGIQPFPNQNDLLAPLFSQLSGSNNDGPKPLIPIQTQQSATGHNPLQSMLPGLFPQPPTQPNQQQQPSGFLSQPLPIPQQPRMANGRGEPSVANGALVIPEMPDCVDGSRARIQLIDGISLVSAHPLASIQLASADACLHVCRANAHLDGTRFTRICRSAIFDRVANRCDVIDDAITPNGELNYAPNTNTLYFEKFCIPESELPLGCDDVVRRIPQHTLDSRATGTGAVITTETQTECIRRCVTAQKKLGFECSSASYYFDWSEDNCYLSRFTRLSRPDIYVGEHKQLVDYMELAPCMKRAWQHDEIAGSKQDIRKSPSKDIIRLTDPPRKPPTRNFESSSDDSALSEATMEHRSAVDSRNSVSTVNWSTWSECDAKTETRSRYRECEFPTDKITKNENVEECEPDIQMVSCQPTGQSSFVQETLNSVEKNNEATQSGGSYELVAPKLPSDYGKANLNHHDSDFNEETVKKHSVKNANGCDPREKCCSKVSEIPSSLVRGCSIGYRILEDETTVACMPDDC